MKAYSRKIIILVFLISLLFHFFRNKSENTVGLSKEQPSLAAFWLVNKRGEEELEGINNNQDRAKLSKNENLNVSLNYEKVFASRRRRLDSVCNKYNFSAATEHGSLYHRKQSVNKCTARYFEVKGTNLFICNVLKGGSTSWKVFLAKNKIKTSLLVDCEDCPSEKNIRIVQVRHPMERLLATWRHVFKNSGWKSLELDFKKYEGLYSNINWNYFIEEVVLKDMFSKTESELDNLNGGGVWVKLHWAPYWFTCGICSDDLVPDFILKTETLHEEISYVLKKIRIPYEFGFPHMRVTGTEDNFADGGKSVENYLGSHALAEKYFGQLTKQQVVRLYEMYKIDHHMFGYDPQIYIDMAV